MYNTLYRAGPQRHKTAKKMDKTMNDRVLDSAANPATTPRGGSGIRSRGPSGGVERVAEPGPHLINADRYASEALVGWHDHAGMELVLCTEGRCAIDLGGPRAASGLAATLTAAPQTLFVLPARVPQRQRSQGFTRTTYAVFHLSGYPFDETGRTVDIAAAPELARWLEDLCELFRAPDSSGIQSVTRGLLIAVLERIKALEQARVVAGAQHPTLVLALLYLRRHLRQSVTLAELAAASHVSESHLRALFRAQYGCGPLQHLQNMRIELAQKLLPTPYLRIQEIARQCGYEDARYFARLFARATGQSPRAWRVAAGKSKLEA